MSGVKGRSGRRTKSIEEKCLAIRDKSREILLQTYADPSISLLEKAKLANPIVAKEVTQRIENVNPDITQITIIHDKSTPIETPVENRLKGILPTTSSVISEEVKP